MLGFVFALFPIKHSLLKAQCNAGHIHRHLNIYGVNDPIKGEKPGDNDQVYFFGFRNLDKNVFGDELNTRIPKPNVWLLLA